MDFHVQLYIYLVQTTIELPLYYLYFKMECGYIPDHVRSDYGGGNVDVWRYLITCHADPTSVITGSSVHNERVERMWRDVNRCVVSTFSETFRRLENDDILNPLNEVDMYCLHVIFIPRINKCLTEFKESWNNHGLSSEGNKTPYQLYLEGLQFIETSSTSSIQHTDGSNVNIETPDRVTVPRLRFEPCLVLQQELASINSLQPCNDNGVSMFTNTLHIAGQHLQQCSDCNEIN